MNIEFHLAHGDALTFASDVLILKYAQDRFGVDGDVAQLLTDKGGLTSAQISPARGFFSIVDTQRLVGARHAMFLGTFPVTSFDYDEVHRLARRAVEGLAEASIDAKHIATTLHGVGFGLDAGESAQSLVLGFLEGLRVVQNSPVERITIIEKNTRVLGIASEAIRKLGIDVRRPTDSEALATRLPVPLSPTVVPGEQVPSAQPERGHIFVAMPYAAEF